MPVIRPSTCLRAARAVQRTSTTSTTAAAAANTARAFSTTPRQSSAGESHADPPTGWLFGVKPGEKYQPEGWENIYFYGFFGSLLVFSVAYAFKPDTS
jgi:hypothetical protein